MEKKAKLPPGESAIQADWFSQAKLRVFRSNVQQLDSLYGMLSVSLDEASALRNGVKFERAFAVLSITATLCARLARQLKWLLRTLQELVSQYDLTPGVTPLHIASLDWNSDQFSALKASLVKKLHFPRQLQFLDKCRELEALVEHLSHHFCQTASALKETNSSNAPEIWAAMDDEQNDLNTCVRETIVTLKCVLRVMPEEQLGIFENAAAAQSTGLKWERKVNRSQAKRQESVAALSKSMGQILRRPR